jgi:hypothetical protein
LPEEEKNSPTKYLSEKFVRATTNKFGPKVLRLQPKAALNSPPQELEEGARSALYLLVYNKKCKSCFPYPSPFVVIDHTLTLFCNPSPSKRIKINDNRVNEKNHLAHDRLIVKDGVRFPGSPSQDVLLDPLGGNSSDKPPVRLLDVLVADLDGAFRQVTQSNSHLLLGPPVWRGISRDRRESRRQRRYKEKTRDTRQKEYKDIGKIGKQENKERKGKNKGGESREERASKGEQRV